MNSTYFYDWKEELANAITHGIGFLLSIPALVMLIIFAAQKNNPVYMVSFIIFGTTMLLLYLFSTMLHSFKPSRARKVFAILDHSAIYLLIAGTYTPLVLISINGAFGWTLFGIIWGLALLGITFKCFMIHRFRILSTLFYILMGWLVIIAIKPLYASLTGTGFGLLLTGGILYTIGAIFYIWRRLPYSHAIWHLFVIGGNAFMYFCVLYFV
ncbi:MULTISPECIES: PAQR family membrane homeostasis protein TrhA [Heyndrickxia]|uniref:Hemolysin D n=1 Tax=Heyndrickxia oleronia TaxID=38875 RepID=A0A8E2I6C7_9BACI|nr:hemolysin III family protein [Heyndrickxia oleronia]NYV65387.1 hemolysin III family protein [Bacillus sp. Gen3]OJH19778.1 hemolysin D [Bacillus obstructivus]MCI1593434.1 hemolysin III family protein [Heyndrickxia oleronia]MCI1615253.1 hemolysin III family protein [Heyndrickxia oleronia]MCI1763335.1 hemolysin III family protein [Heyndrickxia oleronia]